ncbi:Pentatricopeptide repeat [Dillenia turbinata]|uniref:Pentatricopeptide repeat n=1 Tax=Dillenia turbinata TaxID=194707 RepID=A0AAN8Z3X2_9MAGN
MPDTQCTTVKGLEQIHANFIKTGLVKHPNATSRLLAFCSASPCADMNYACLIFSQIHNANLLTWNTIIRGFSNSSTPQLAISLFIHMVYSPIQPQKLAYPSVSKAYAHLGLALDVSQLHGKKLFDRSVEFDVVAWNSMLTGLAKIREFDASRRLFDKMPKRSHVSWNSMISGYVRNGRLIEALQLFREMQEKIEPSEFTMVSLLNASARLGELNQGEWIHEYIRKNKIELNVIVVAGIIYMYCKCGCIEKAIEFFERTPCEGLSCWNSMILGLVEDAVYLIGGMPIEQDITIWASLLSACRENGNVEMGKRAARHLKSLDPSESCGHVLMSSLYATSGEFENAIEERLVMKEMLLFKELGCSWIEVNGEIHEFVCCLGLHSHAKQRHTHGMRLA